MDHIWALQKNFSGQLHHFWSNLKLRWILYNLLDCMHLTDFVKVNHDNCHKCFTLLLLKSDEWFSQECHKLAFRIRQENLVLYQQNPLTDKLVFCHQLFARYHIWTTRRSDTFIICGSEWYKEVTSLDLNNLIYWVLILPLVDGLGKGTYQFEM